MSLAFDGVFFDSLWTNVLLIMKERMSGQSFNTWFGGTRIVDHDSSVNRITVSVPTLFARNWLSNHYADDIENAFIALTDQEYMVSFVTDPDVTKNQDVASPQIQPYAPGHDVTGSYKGTTASTENTTFPGISPFNPRYTFDTFVIGAGNRFAHAACLAVAEAPANAYNPLFIYGGVGLGKTHLMHAIGHYVSKRNPQSRVLYLSSERFTNEFISAIRENRGAEFRERYRSIDVLLIDDIQFLANKEGTQEEFFHTFNDLHAAAKQIVITSDRAPREIATLQDRLRSRFEWGLLTDVQPPDLETRIAILQRKAKADGFHIPREVTQYIATQVDTNIRELEGALIRVVAYSSLVNQDITVSLAEQALKDIVSPDKPRSITVGQIQKVIGDHYGLRLDELKAKKRTRNVAFPRQIAMYLTRELTDLSLPRIGEAFGGRDHTTVMHACDRVSQALVNDHQLKMTVDRLAEAIRTLH